MYFDVSFMTWMLIGALSVLIAQELHLTDFQKGFLVAVPLLGGAFFRIVLGLLSDLFGPKKVGMFSLLLQSFRWFGAVWLVKRSPSFWGSDCCWESQVQVLP